MPYNKQTWVNSGTSGGLTATSEANAERLGYMENGIARYSAFLDVDGAFGGGWAGVIAACAEAEASGGPSAVVRLGKGPYNATSTINITNPFTIEGGGNRGTRLRHSGSFAGPLFRAENMKRSNQWESTVGSGPIQTYDESLDNGGMTFKGFSIVDDNRSVANRHGIYVLDMDDMYMEDVQFGYLTGTALKLGADEADAGIAAISSGRLRESDFHRIRIYRCGSGSPSGTPDVPAFILQNASSSGDGSNQNYFNQFRFVYNEGRMLLRGPGFEGNSLRRTIFSNVQLHALADNQNWSPVQYFPFDLVTLEGAVRETIFQNVMVNGNRAGTYCWRMKADSGGQPPKRLILDNINVVNVHGGLVRVDQGDSVAIRGQGLGAVAENILSVGAGSGFIRGSINEEGINSPAGKSSIGAGSAYAYFHGQSVAI
jgi:hypothetical protein